MTLLCILTKVSEFCLKRSPIQRSCPPEQGVGGHCLPALILGGTLAIECTEVAFCATFPNHRGLFTERAAVCRAACPGLGAWPGILGSETHLSVAPWEQPRGRVAGTTADLTPSVSTTLADAVVQQHSSEGHESVVKYLELRF